MPVYSRTAKECLCSFSDTGWIACCSFTLWTKPFASSKVLLYDCSKPWYETSAAKYMVLWHLRVALLIPVCDTDTASSPKMLHLSPQHRKGYCNDGLEISQLWGIIPDQASCADQDPTPSPPDTLIVSPTQTWSGTHQPEMREKVPSSRLHTVVTKTCRRWNEKQHPHLSHTVSVVTLMLLKVPIHFSQHKYCDIRTLCTCFYDSFRAWLCELPPLLPISTSKDPFLPKLKECNGAAWPFLQCVMAWFLHSKELKLI